MNKLLKCYPIMFLAIMWVVFLLSTLSSNYFMSWGIVPRQPSSLLHIFFAPFLHVNLNHIVSNSFPFLLVSFPLWMVDKKLYLSNFFLISIGAGMFTWLFGSPGTVHVGASSVIFGMFGTLLLFSYYSRKFWHFLISIGVACYMGFSMLMNLIPQESISFTGHLGGFLTGLLTAKFLFTDYKKIK